MTEEVIFHVYAYYHVEDILIEAFSMIVVIRERPHVLLEQNVRNIGHIVEEKISVLFVCCSSGDLASKLATLIHSRDFPAESRSCQPILGQLQNHSCELKEGYLSDACRFKISQNFT